MGDLNESLIALVLALMATTSGTPGSGDSTQESATGWQNFAMVASDIRTMDVPACRRQASGGYRMDLTRVSCETTEVAESTIR